MKIKSQSAFQEARFMAEMALAKVSTRIKPESYWESAMMLLREAYGLSQFYGVGK